MYVREKLEVLVISKSSYHSWEITSGTEADVITSVLLRGKTSKGSRRGAYDHFKNVESQASGLEIMPLILQVHLRNSLEMHLNLSTKY